MYSCNSKVWDHPIGLAACFDDVIFHLIRILYIVKIVLRELPTRFHLEMQSTLICDLKITQLPPGIIKMSLKHEINHIYLVIQNISFGIVEVCDRCRNFRLHILVDCNSG